MDQNQEGTCVLDDMDGDIHMAYGGEQNLYNKYMGHCDGAVWEHLWRMGLDKARLKYELVSKSRR